MKRFHCLWVVHSLLILLIAGAALAKSSDTRDAIADPGGIVDIVGDVQGNAPGVSKAVSDTTWIADWAFEGCDETGWTNVDNYILNDGNVYWSVNSNFSGTGNIVGNAASVGGHDLCWVIPDGYANNWNQAICIHYVGDSYLSFDYLVDTEGVEVVEKLPHQSQGLIRVSTQVD